MISKDDFGNIITRIKEGIGDEQSALLSEDLLELQSAYANTFDEASDASEKVTKLADEKDELLKVNGRLFQKLGTNEPVAVVQEMEQTEPSEPELEIHDVIDEKGNFI